MNNVNANETISSFASSSINGTYDALNIIVQPHDYEKAKLIREHTPE